MLTERLAHKLFARTLSVFSDGVTSICHVLMLFAFFVVCLFSMRLLAKGSILYPSSDVLDVQFHVTHFMEERY